MRSPLLALVGLCLLVTGCGTPAPPPEATPAPPPAPTRDVSSEAARKLREIRERVEQDEAIQEVLDLPQTVLLPRAVRTWSRARAALREIVADSGLRWVTQRLSARKPTPAILADASRIALVERLLDRRPGSESSLWEPGEDPLLGRLIEQGLAQRWEPSMDGRRSGMDREKKNHVAGLDAWSPYRAELEKDGRRWKTLRSLDDFHIKTGPHRSHNPRVRIQTLGGNTFEDPLGKVPSAVIGDIYEAKDRYRLRHAPKELRLELDPVEGDLFLALTAWQLTRFTHLELRVLGAEETLVLAVSRPSILEAEPGPPDFVPGGYALRIRSDVLPKGPRRLRIRPVAIQGIGRVEPTISLGEVLQLVAGPPPEVFRTHVWKAVRVDDAELTRRREARLKAELAALTARLAEKPGDPDALLEGGMAMRRAGHPQAAYETLLRANRLRGDHPPTLNALGEVGWEIGDRRAAADFWWRSYRLDPSGHARDMIREHAPRVFDEHREVASVDEFLQLAAYLQDFRRQREIELALARFNVPRGLNIGLDERNSQSLVADLAKKGFLARPGGPPSGRGIYLTRGRGQVFSTEFGSQDTPRAPPPALEASRGWSVPARVLRAALATGQAAAIEVGLPLVPEEELGPVLRKTAPKLAGLTDPWARDVLLTRVRGLGKDSLAPLAGWLRGLLDVPERPVTWQALGLLQRLGAPDLPKIDEAEGRNLVLAIARGRAPESAGDALLAGLGDRARAFLLEQLASRNEARFAFAARHLKEHVTAADREPVAKAVGRPLARTYRDELRSVLQALTGKNPPADPAGWKAWLGEGR